MVNVVYYCYIGVGRSTYSCLLEMHLPHKMFFVVCAIKYQDGIRRNFERTTVNFLSITRSLKCTNFNSIPNARN